MSKSQGDLGLSLTGMRIAPRDPNSHQPKVGVRNEVKRADPNLIEMPSMTLKERTGFSGGFKIPEEIRKSKEGKTTKKKEKKIDDSFETNQQNQITKDEIFQHLNLGHNDQGSGVGRHGTNTKSALAKDLVEGIEKDLEKLKRQKENLLLRRTLAMKGSIDDQTDEEREREYQEKLRSELEGAGTFVIAASPKKLQVMRHQASQLASNANLNLDDLERMRRENEERIKQLEEMYISKKMNGSVGGMIREKMGFKSSNPLSPQQSNNDILTFGSPDKSARKKSSKRVRINDEPDVNTDEDIQYNWKRGSQKEKSLDRGEKQQLFGPKSQDRPREDSEARDISKSRAVNKPIIKSDRSRSQSQKRKKSESPPKYLSPRQQLYEAKFEKYLTNKEQKVKQEKKLQHMSKEDFDRFTKGPESPSKQTQRYKDKDAKFNTAKFEPDSLIPQNYDDEIMREEELRKSTQKNKDQFQKLGVSNEDKMTFFLLKWIFNAIKRDSEMDDPKLQGRSYIAKNELVKQLVKNAELMQTLGYSDASQVHDAVRSCKSSKDGCFMWEEFLDFFFMKQNSTLQQRLNIEDNWWRRVDRSQELGHKEDQKTQIDNKENQTKIQSLTAAPVPRYKGDRDHKYEDPDKKPVKMTASLKILEDTRKQRTEKDVEDEFKQIQEKKLIEQKQFKQQFSPSKKATKTTNPWEGEDNEGLEETLGIKREKSKCLLLQSQVHLMNEIFNALDKYGDQLLRRSQYIMTLRTDERIVEFIDVDAVQVPYSNRILTLDEVLVEIEKDELYEQIQLGKKQDQINHKEFITWREFIGYFYDYKEIDERNQRTKEIQKTRQSLQNQRAEQKIGDDQGKDIRTLMEQEKERRLKDLPKLRPADQIDVSEKQLQLIKDIYDSLPKASTQKDIVHTIDFFIAIRKNPQIRTLSSAIARDPEGTSRLPRETFQQVFDRMENEIQAKQTEWPVIVEYFTKRGRPLQREEIVKLQEDDKREREEEESKRRAEEEAERRRMARLMEDLEDKEDFEEYERRQKTEEQAKLLDEKRARRMRDEDEENDGERDEDDDGYGREDDYDHDEEEEFQRDGDGYQSDPELGTGKRSYKFGGDPSEENRGRSMTRNQSAPRSAKSAKTYDERDLRNVKLTTRDYVDHQRSQSKKGKYGVTVPKPFGFEIREKTKQKSIREQKVDEMVAEKKIQEEHLLKYHIRPKPIPPEVLIPRYQSIIDANERRRLETKHNSVAITKAREAPFSFYDRDKNKQKLDPEDYIAYDLKKPGFKANPIPRACSVLIFDQMMKQSDQARQERIRKNAEINYQKAKLPDRMQMHEEKMKQGSFQKQNSQMDSYTFKPKINELVTREQFAKQQMKFNEKLNKKKSQQQVTRPKSPNFTKTGTKNLDREYLNEGQPPPMMDKFQQALKRTLSKAEDKAAENPSSTKAMTLAMQRRREELEEKRKKEEMKKKEDQDRFTNQNRLKGIVQAALQDRIKDDKDKRQKELEDRKAQSRKDEQKNRNLIKELETKARNRPLLIDSIHQKKQATNLAKIKATKEFIDILKSNGLKPDDHLTEEQKDLLEEAEFIERRKNEIRR